MSSIFGGFLEKGLILFLVGLKICLFWVWERFIFKIEQGKVRGLAVVIPTPTSSCGGPILIGITTRFFYTCQSFWEMLNWLCKFTE